MFHLGWFLGNGFGIQPWRSRWAGTNGTDWMKPDLYRNLAESLERAGFDYILIEDTAMVEDSYKGSSETALKYGLMVPKNDPLPLVPLMTSTTKHIGVITTVSTLMYPPFLAARLVTTLDHLTEGRVGMNIVTSVSNRVAQNFGFPEHVEHDLRYEMADEWADVVGQLWESWDEGAVVLDLDTPRYADHTKVNPINFNGKHFSSRGPMNTIPGPQRRPVIAQAGNSEPGRNVAAKHADTMLASFTTVEAMKEFREDMHRRLASFGRSPEELKILFLCSPVVDDTDEGAEERFQTMTAAARTDDQIEELLWGLSYVSGGTVDFGSFDLDAPVPEIVGNGEQSSLANFYRRARGKTLREAASTRATLSGLKFVGAPDTVAAQMDEAMQEVGGDGFLLYSEMTRRNIAEIADGLAPALKKRGCIRQGYDGTTFRENLLQF